MRGRILWAGVLAVVLATACSRKDSLYIDSSKDGAPPAEPAAQGPAKGAEPTPPPDARPAPAQPER